MTIASYRWQAGGVGTSGDSLVGTVTRPVLSRHYHHSAHIQPTFCCFRCFDLPGARTGRDDGDDYIFKRTFAKILQSQRRPLLAPTSIFTFKPVLRPWSTDVDNNLD